MWPFIWMSNRWPQPGRNLDVYAADLTRIETLAGPQGTLFGASSQAGAVRMIANKPDASARYARLKLGAAKISDGEPGHNLELMLNLPLSDRLALRAVAYRDHQGGWIDNVAGTVDTRASARFRPTGTVRANGLPVSPARAGIQAEADLTSGGLPNRRQCRAGHP